MVIYSPYDGVVRELMYEVGDIATKGKPVVMIEVEEEGVHYLGQLSMNTFYLF